MALQRFSTRPWQVYSFGFLIWGMAILSQAQDAEEAAVPVVPRAGNGAVAPPIPLSTGKFTTRVDGYTIESRGPWMRGERLRGRQPDLWSVYAHGIVDFFATVVPWEKQFLPRQDLDTWLDPDTTVGDNPYRTSAIPSLRLEGGQSLVAGLPLIGPDDLERHAGQTVRIFIWMCGEDSGRGTHLWTSAPRMDALIVEAAGRSVVQHRGPMATRGTFPWHCYSMDITLPSAPIAVAEVNALTIDDGVDRSRGLYLSFANPASGTAWFSTASWEAVDATSIYTLAQKQDPKTGSMAPNCKYDELPVHLCSPKVMTRGLVPAYLWSFLGGRGGGAVNVPNILSRKGLGGYLEDVALQDSHHFLQGVTRLPAWYHAGVRFKLLPPSEGDWFEYLGSRMLSLQDAETGFWGTEARPRSMGVTAAVAEGMFGNVTIPRADREPIVQPWLSCGIEQLPRKSAIAQTVLSMECTAEDAAGGPGGWSSIAYHHAAGEVLAFDSGCDLAASAHAVFLLRRCSADLPADLKAQADAAVRRAMQRVRQVCVLPTGLWKQNSDDTRATHGAFMDRLIDASPMLEHRTVTTLPTPKIADRPEMTDGKVRIEWKNPSDEAASLRVYALPKDAPVDTVSDAHLVGIIQTSDGDARTLDPLVLVQEMRRSAADAWGMTWFEGNGGYTAWKLDQLADPLVVSVDGAPISVRLSQPAATRLLVATANWYGETSVPVEVRFRVQQTAEEGVFDDQEPQPEEVPEEGDQDDAEDQPAW